MTATAGVTLKNSSFDGIIFGVSGSFNLFGATLQTTDANPLTFQYDFGEDRYEWTGGLTLKVNGNSIAVNLGYVTQPGVPGLVIREGIVESFDANVTTDFSFFGAEFQTTPGGVTLQYDRTTEQYVMFGGMQLVDSMTKNPIFSVQMGTGASDAGLLIENGSLKQLETTITSNTFQAGPLHLERYQCRIQMDAGLQQQGHLHRLRQPLHPGGLAGLGHARRRHYWR